MVDLVSTGNNSDRCQVKRFYTVPRHTIETVIDGRRVLMVANEVEERLGARSPPGHVDGGKSN